MREITVRQMQMWIDSGYICIGKSSRHGGLNEKFPRSKRSNLYQDLLYSFRNKTSSTVIFVAACGTNDQYNTKIELYLFIPRVGAKPPGTFGWNFAPTPYEIFHRYRDGFLGPLQDTGLIRVINYARRKSPKKLTPLGRQQEKAVTAFQMNGGEITFREFANGTKNAARFRKSWTGLWTSLRRVVPGMHHLLGPHGEYPLGAAITIKKGGYRE